MGVPANSPFTPGQSIVVTAGSASAAKALPTGAGGSQCELQVSGSADACVAFGGASAAATAVTTSFAANNYPVLAGQAKIVTIPVDATYIAYIRAASADATLYITIGNGA